MQNQLSNEEQEQMRAFSVKAGAAILLVACAQRELTDALEDL